eukprot:g1766.t1
MGTGSSAVNPSEPFDVFSTWTCGEREQEDMLSLITRFYELDIPFGVNDKQLQFLARFPGPRGLKQCQEIIKALQLTPLSDRVSILIIVSGSIVCQKMDLSLKVASLFRCFNFRRLNDSAEIRLTFDEITVMLYSVVTGFSRFIGYRKSVPDLPIFQSKTEEIYNFLGKSRKECCSQDEVYRFVKEKLVKDLKVVDESTMFLRYFAMNEE